MSSPFLVAFVDAVVSRLVTDGQLEIEPGGQTSVVTVVAAVALACQGRRWRAKAAKPSRRRGSNSLG